MTKQEIWCISMKNLEDKYQIEELLLRKFLEGEINLGTLTKELDNYIAIDFTLAPDIREIKKNQFEGILTIPIEKSHLIKMLDLYISGQLSEDELSNWAAFIFLSGLFYPNRINQDSNIKVDEETFWDTFQELMTPSIFGGLDKEKARLYLSRLENI